MRCADAGSPPPPLWASEVGSKLRVCFVRRLSGAIPRAVVVRFGDCGEVVNVSTEPPADGELSRCVLRVIRESSAGPANVTVRIPLTE